MLNDLNANLLEITYIVSFDLWSRHFSQSFAAGYGAELSFSSNNYCSLVTWQMLLLVCSCKPNSMTNNEFIVSLFIPCPSLSLFFLYCFMHTNFRKHMELSQFPVLLKFVVWLPCFPRRRYFHLATFRSSSAYLLI